MRNRHLAALGLGAILFSAGCSIYSVVNHPGLFAQQQTTQAQVQQSNPPAIQLTLTSRYLVNGLSTKLRTWAIQEGMKSFLQDEVAQFPSLKQARFDNSGAQFQLVIGFTLTERFNWILGIVGWASFFLIPTHVEFSRYLTAELYQGPTLLKRYEADQVARVWYHPFFAFTRQGWSSMKDNRGWKNIVDDLLLQIERDAPTYFAK